MDMLVKIESGEIFKRGDRLVIKSILQLLKEGWEPIVWGWIKNREINYYNGIEKALGEGRVLSVRFDTGGEDIFCNETDYKLAREAVLGVVRKVA